MSIKRAVQEGRRGRFFISQDLLRDYPDEVLMYVFKEMIVTRADYGFGWDAVEYEGYSMDFDPCSQPVKSPEYILSWYISNYADESKAIHFEGWTKV